MSTSSDTPEAFAALLPDAVNEATPTECRPDSTEVRGTAPAGEVSELATDETRRVINRGPKGGGQLGNNGGAPKGNVNAAKDGAFTLAMRAAREALKRGRLQRRKTHDQEALAVVEEVGLAGSPLGLRIAADLAVIARERAELEMIVARPNIGRVNKHGQLTAPYSRLLDLTERSFVLHRELVDRLADLVAAQPKAVTVPTVVFKTVDGQVIEPKSGTEPEAKRAPVESPAAITADEREPVETPEQCAARERATRARPSAPVAVPTLDETGFFGPGGGREPVTRTTHAEFDRSTNIATLDF